MVVFLHEDHADRRSKEIAAVASSSGAVPLWIARARRGSGTLGLRVGVVFIDPADADSMEKYLALYDVLSGIFPDTISGPKLDIALLQRANAKLQLDAIDHGVVIFEGDARARADYEEYVLKQYDDYRFLQKEYEEANLAAFRT